MIRVCFSGVDGSGKTTQIKMLEKVFDQRNVSYEYIHLFSGSSSVVSKIHDKPGISSLIKRIRGLKNGSLTNTVKVCLRVINVLVDSWLTTWANKNKKVDVLIYDRYFYDVLAVIVHDFPKLKLIRKLVLLFPRPEIIFIFVSKPEVVVERKNEHDLQSATRYINIYNEMAVDLKVSTINAEMGIDDVHRNITKRFKPLL